MGHIHSVRTEVPLVRVFQVWETQHDGPVEVLMVEMIRLNVAQRASDDPVPAVQLRRPMTGTSLRLVQTHSVSLGLPRRAHHLFQTMELM